MGELSRALALPEKFDHKGKTYTLSPITFEVMGDWERYLETRAFDALDRQRHRYPPTEFSRRERELIEAIAAGSLSFFSEPSMAAINGHILGPTYRRWLMIRLQAGQNEGVTEELVAEMAEEQAEKISRLMKKMDAPDPNSPAPAVAPAAAG